MRKIPLGILAAALAAGWLTAVAAAPAGADVATTGDHTAPCVSASPTTEPVENVEYRYMKIAQFWKGQPQGASREEVPGDDVAEWGTEPVVIGGQPQITEWQTEREGTITATNGVDRKVDEPFWMGPGFAQKSTGWFKYVEMERRTVGEKPGEVEVEVPCEVPAVEEPSEEPTPEPTEQVSEEPVDEPVVDESESVESAAPAAEETPAEESEVPTTIDAGLAGEEEGSAPAMWPLFALGGAAVVALGLIVAVRRRLAAQNI